MQIDTINVVERCHHQILYTRIPGYERAHLRQAQSEDKSVFEYWTHALAYVPVRDIRFFLGDMRLHRTEPHRWNQSLDMKDYRRVIRMIRAENSAPLPSNKVTNSPTLARITCAR